jgi:hypothetical protein
MLILQKLLFKRKYRLLNRLFYIIVFVILSVSATGQTKEKLLQVSGIIVDEMYRPVPGVAVISKKLRRGSISERSGIYSITSIPGDTIFYRALGFKRYHTIIPDDYEERHSTVDIVLEIDTITIEEVTILPWKSYNDFLKEMSKEQPVDPLIENMHENLASIYVAMSNQTGVKVSPEAGFYYSMSQNFNNLATKNQYPVNNLLNPFAWSKFIKGMQNGLLKNQTVKKPINAKVRKKKSDKKRD